MKTLRRRHSRRLAFVFLAGLVASSLLAFAEPRRSPAPVGKKATPRASRAAPEIGDASTHATSVQEPLESVSTVKSDGGKSAALDQKTVDGGQRVFRFGEVEVEGRLKSPQIVYFLRRVRAEFAADDLGHRSFMLELRETKNEPSF